MTARYPVLLDLRRTRILVVGGGSVATRKVETLVASGGRPDIIAPVVTDALKDLVDRIGLAWRARDYETADSSGYQLVFAATERAEVNAQVTADARVGGGWVNAADDPEGSTFQVPALIQQGEITVTVSTGGAAPLLSRRLRERLETIVTPGLGRAAERLRRAREQVHARWPADEDRRRSFWFSLVTPEFLDSAIAGRDEEVEGRIEACL